MDVKSERWHGGPTPLQIRPLQPADWPAVMVAVNPAGAVLGTDDLRPNSLALGAHGANAGYMVAEHCSSTWW